MLTRVAPITPITPITPLPVRVEPQPGEELASFLARTARSLHYPRTTWLLQPERLASPIPPSSTLSLLTRPSDYTFLSTLLALSEDQLYSMTLHPLEALSRHLFCFPQFRKKHTHQLHQLLSHPQTTCPSIVPHCHLRRINSRASPLTPPTSHPHLHALSPGIGGL